ncbi:hypothetical protein [Tenacibaculum haliotis]|uniref:hypothetical protein n=1 Tax=Tenacibaculum haliotis TaxID=1888914 RepID=UPI0021AFBC3C|nr:hypothetical protein [Tenacibaculum haliotis]MCT4699252.1 hypothetical protein [Tenacibaculum haliotis]
MDKEHLIKQQEKRYNNLNFAVAIKKDNNGIIQNFIDSEEEARLHDFQGQFYPSFHYEINRVMKTKMTKISQKNIYLAYYYRIKLGIWDVPSKLNFPLFLAAVEKNILDNDMDKTYVSASKMYLLFDFKNNSDLPKIATLSYEDYIASIKFLNLSNSYLCYPNLRKKRIRFAPFLSNKLLLTRIKNGLYFYLDSDFETAASLVLLLLDTNETSKKALLNLHKKELKNTQVWLLGSFYKDFQSEEINKPVLIDLYDKFPKEWIDEYQKTNYY